MSGRQHAHHALPRKPARPGETREELVKAIPNLRAFAIALSGNVLLADDLVQDTLMKAWSHRDSFASGTNFKAWLFTIMRNTYFSDCRKRMRERRAGDGDAVADLAVHAEQHGHLDMSDFLAALARLPPDQREALMLVGAEGFSYDEAARISGTEIGTIKSRVHRARTRLADMLEISTTAEFGPDPSSGAIIGRSIPGHRRA